MGRASRGAGAAGKIAMNHTQQLTEEYLRETWPRAFNDRRPALEALLLSVDFDSGVTRRHLFAESPAFLGKITLLDRIVWYANPDPSKENPKENCAWFLWSHAPHDGARIM